jgi:hypothetical protein
MKTLILPFIYQINGLKTTAGGALYKEINVDLSEDEVLQVVYAVSHERELFICANYNPKFEVLALEALIKHYQVMCERMPHDSSIGLDGKPEFPELKNTLSYW